MMPPNDYPVEQEQHDRRHDDRSVWLPVLLFGIGVALGSAWCLIR